MRTYKTRSTHRHVGNSSTTDRTTAWLLLLVITALVIALTFSDADGSVLRTLL